MTFEEKILALISAKDGNERQKLINKFSSEPEFASRYYVDATTLDQYMQINAKRFKPIADRAAYLRGLMRNKGWTDKRYQKYTGEIPEPLFLERPEFSSSIPRAIRDKNIRMFLQKYPQFRVDK